MNCCESKTSRSAAWISSRIASYCARRSTVGMMVRTWLAVVLIFMRAREAVNLSLRGRVPTVARGMCGEQWVLEARDPRLEVRGRGPERRGRVKQLFWRRGPSGPPLLMPVTQWNSAYECHSERIPYPTRQKSGRSYTSRRGLSRQEGAARGCYRGYPLPLVYRDHGGDGYGIFWNREKSAR